MELAQRVAINNVVMVMVIDRMLWGNYGPSFLENIASAGISYWLVAALDPETSQALGQLGAHNRCFNAPPSVERKYKLSHDAQFVWGSYQWTETTWLKVQVVHAVYELGFHVIHSDADVTWFRDPMPYFLPHLSGPADVIFSTDALSTTNGPGEDGLEKKPSSKTAINTGLYLIRQRPDGLLFLDLWLKLQWADAIGHDQDGLNTLVRGSAYRGDPTQSSAHESGDPDARYYFAARPVGTAVALLPVSSFANTYTYVNERLWQKLNHTLYSVHWVWGGSTMESKRQCMRDAIKFHDKPDYYTQPYLMTFDLDQITMPDGFNDWMNTEKMIRFHVASANHQLQQAYYAFAIALIANRTLVMPKFQCYCSKNWYMTFQCRVNGERSTTFPFTCSLSQLLRARRLQRGLSLPGNTEYSGQRVFVREYSFLENPKVPQEVKGSFLEVVPSELPRPPGLDPDQLVLATDDSRRGPGRRITVAAPLQDWELRHVLGRYRDVRVLHFPQPTRTLAGFAKQLTHRQFDEEVQKLATYWCCRGPTDMKWLNLTARMQLVVLPPDRYHNLPRPAPGDASYLHDLPKTKSLTP